MRTPTNEKQMTTQAVDSAAPEGCMGPKYIARYIVILLLLIAICDILMFAELGSLFAFTSTSAQPATIIASPSSDAVSSSSEPVTTNPTTVPNVLPPIINRGNNVCAGKDPALPNVMCIVNAVTNVGPQAGANVTVGYQGSMNVDHGPITTPFWQNGMCPVNVHWHVGAEHLSVGQYDENGSGPKSDEVGEIRQGHRCYAYDPNDSKFTRPYEWKWCNSMEVGETYEVHWPHSAAGACGTPNQYQTPFEDGVFCTDEVLSETASQIGVQAQVFVVVNDDRYFWPDMIRGMIVDGEMGKDVAKYTGSTTGDIRNNEICSQYSPITWQVDRRCHMISASSFDKLCYDMLQQRDDMSGDVHPHGSRETVADELAANNQYRLLRRNKKFV